MRLFLIVFLCFFFLSAYAYDHFYSVSGANQNGDYLEGGIFSINGSRYVSGNLTDVNGDSHSFQGEMNDRGQMSGETDDGDSVNLNINHSPCCNRDAKAYEY